MPYEINHKAFFFVRLHAFGMVSHPDKYQNNSTHSCHRD